jgi:hypothetical protein
MVIGRDDLSTKFCGFRPQFRIILSHDDSDVGGVQSRDHRGTDLACLIAGRVDRQEHM